MFRVCTKSGLQIDFSYPNFGNSIFYRSHSQLGEREYSNFNGIFFFLGGGEGPRGVGWRGVREQQKFKDYCSIDNKIDIRIRLS